MKFPGFKNAEVAAKYSTTRTTDPIIHQPGGKNRNGFRCKLSDLNLHRADQLYASKGQNLLQLKAAANDGVIEPE